MTIRTRVTRVLFMALALGVVTVVAAPPSFAAPSLQVSATDGLRTGQQITIEGSGFAPNLKGIAVGECRKGYEGPADCNLSGGATFRNADAQGAFAPVTITLSETFRDVDCTKEQCLIAAAPLPTSSSAAEVAANTVEVPITFGGKASAPSPTPKPKSARVATAPPAQAAILTASGESAGHGLMVALLVSNLLLAAAGIYLGTQHLRRSSR